MKSNPNQNEVTTTQVPFTYKFFSAFFYCACSFLLVVINKYVLTVHAFPSFLVRNETLRDNSWNFVYWSITFKQISFGYFTLQSTSWKNFGVCILILCTYLGNRWHHKRHLKIHDAQNLSSYFIFFMTFTIAVRWNWSNDSYASDLVSAKSLGQGVISRFTEIHVLENLPFAFSIFR